MKKALFGAAALLTLTSTAFAQTADSENLTITGNVPLVVAVTVANENVELSALYTSPGTQHDITGFVVQNNSGNAYSVDIGTGSAPFRLTKAGSTAGADVLIDIDYMGTSDDCQVAPNHVGTSPFSMLVEGTDPCAFDIDLSMIGSNADDDFSAGQYSLVIPITVNP